MERVEYEKLIIQELSNLYRNDELNLTPWYQRRSVWTKPQKSYLINTLFEQKPVPTIYIRHSIDIESDRSLREIVDGQQRIRSILEYLDDDFPVKHPNHKKKVKYSQMSRSEAHKFKLTSLSIGYLLGATEEDVIEIFGRLNSVAKTLNAQEKRNAQFSGEFKQFCLREAVTRLSLWRDLGIFSANDIARMSEVQFVSDLTLNLLNGLSDFSAAKLNNIYSEFDEVFSRQERLSNRLERVFSQIAGLSPEAIKDTVFSRLPLFFSLCIALDAAPKKIPKKRIESTLYKADALLTSGIHPSEMKRADAEFYIACTASTQRIKSRKIRDSYINKLIKT